MGTNRQNLVFAALGVQSALATLIATEAATRTRAAGTVAARNVARTNLLSLLRATKANVQQIADADPEQAAAIITSAGMQVRKTAPRSKATRTEIAEWEGLRSRGEAIPSRRETLPPTREAIPRMCAALPSKRAATPRKGAALQGRAPERPVAMASAPHTMQETARTVRLLEGA